MCTEWLERSDYRDTDTVEDLLKAKDFTTVMHCHSREAAKKHCSGITEVEHGTIVAACMPYQARLKTCFGCGVLFHKAGRQQYPA